MTTSITSATWNVSTNSAAQALFQSISGVFTAVGLVQTADTGQLTSATSNTTSNATLGYQVFGFPDALQSTKPIYIRVEYRTDQTARPWLKFTVGSSTDGSGTIGSPNMATSNGEGLSNYQSPLSTYACYVDGTFSIVAGYGASPSTTTSNNCVGNLVVDRARDATGVAQGSGYLVECGGPSNGYSGSRSIYGAASPASYPTFIPSLIPNPNALTSAAGANVNVFRHYMMVPNVAPSVGVLSYFNSEFGALTPFSATVLGSPHTYLPVGRAMSFWSATANSFSLSGIDHCAAIRWE